jgi:Pyruvate/2-oxoglutarate dehydrogenase complex, dehydrogenase (E1) component, eukaryotic type, alpha subunit
VGVSKSLNKDDWIFINYRGHSFYLSKGGSLPHFFAELMGRKDGISKGKAGSMHLASPEHGVMGASAVVASTISHAVGAAMASKIRNENRVFVANFGDGATEQGVFHESLNFASLHKTPVLFLCEDNELAVHASKIERQSFELSKLISAYGIEYFELNEGYDLIKTYEISKKVINLIRREQKPIFLKIKTARYKEHVGPNDDFEAGYRDEKHIQDWKKKDPLIIDKKLINEFDEKINNEIEKAFEFASNSKPTSSEGLLTDV